MDIQTCVIGVIQVPVLPENAIIRNDYLVIKARKSYLEIRNLGKFKSTHWGFNTIDKLTVTPLARIEVRVKLPSGKRL
ncbi:MAG: hypothetical protein QXZ10_02935 [Sulfolobales archaeon]